MKKLIQVAFITLFTLSLMGCSAGKAKTEDITDSTIITQMDTFTKEQVQAYFDIEVPTDLTYEFSASKRFIPSTENPKEDVHHANILQAVYKTKDPISGTVIGYGGILTPDNTGLTGLIVSVYQAEDTKPQELSEAQLSEIGMSFLKDKNLSNANEELTFSGIDSKSSSKDVTILNFETPSRIFAVGVDLYSAKPVYFEFLDKPEAN